MRKQEKKKCKVRFSFTKENKASQKKYMKVGVKKFLRAGMVQARTCGVHAVGMAPTERFKLRRQMAAAPGQKVLVLVYGSIWPGSGRRALHYDYSDLGRRDVDRQMAHRTKRSVDAPGFRVSDLETGERTCRSSYVRDP